MNNLERLKKMEEETKVKVELQKMFCKFNGVPYLCGEGICPYCKHDVFCTSPETICSHTHKTKCDHCDRSLVE